MAMRTWPLWLTHRGVTVGRGFIANVELTGRLVAHQDSTGIWLEGVTPAGLVIDSGASMIDEVQPFVRETLVGALNVLAEDAGTFHEFRDAVYTHFWARRMSRQSRNGAMRSSAFGARVSGSTVSTSGRLTARRPSPLPRWL